MDNHDKLRHGAPVAQQTVHPAEELADEQIIEKCRAAGICWLVPDADPDGFPGGFDMASMHAMRSLLSHAAVSVTPSAQQDFDAEWLAADESKQIDHKGVARYWFNRGASLASRPAAPVQQEQVTAQPQAAELSEDAQHFLAVAMVGFHGRPHADYKAARFVIAEILKSEPMQTALAAQQVPDKPQEARQARDDGMAQSKGASE